MGMELRIFLESRSAFLDALDGGHLYLVLRRVDVAQDGSYVNAENADDLVIQGTVDNVVWGDLLGRSVLLRDSTDGYGAAAGELAVAGNDSVADRNSIDISAMVIAGGGFAVAHR